MLLSPLFLIISCETSPSLSSFILATTRYLFCGGISLARGIFSCNERIHLLSSFTPSCPLYGSISLSFSFSVHLPLCTPLPIHLLFFSALKKFSSEVREFIPPLSLTRTCERELCLSSSSASLSFFHRAISLFHLRFSAFFFAAHFSLVCVHCFSFLSQASSKEERRERD